MIDLPTFQKRIKSLSEILDLSVNEVRVLIAIERVIARVEAHEVLRDNLIFKGGYALFRLVGSTRFTRDLDALLIKGSILNIIPLIGEALALDMGDRIKFYDLKFSEILDQGAYGGYRISIAYQMGDISRKAKVEKLSRMNLDIAVGDYLPDETEKSQMDSLLEISSPISWRVYPLELIFAEKLQVFTQRGSANSRAKDLYDIVLLYEKISNKELLNEFITKVFAHRETARPKSFAQFLREMDTSQLQFAWSSVRLTHSEMSFKDLLSKLELVLLDLDQRD